MARGFRCICAGCRSSISASIFQAHAVQAKGDRKFRRVRQRFKRRFVNLLRKVLQIAAEKGRTVAVVYDRLLRSRPVTAFHCAGVCAHSFTCAGRSRKISARSLEVPFRWSLQEMKTYSSVL